MFKAGVTLMIFHKYKDLLFGGESAVLLQCNSSIRDNCKFSEDKIETSQRQPITAVSSTYTINDN